MKYLILLILILIPTILNAATFKQRLDSLFQEGKDPRTYIDRCGQDASISLKKAYRAILKSQNTAFLTCMETKAADVAQEVVVETARKEFVKNEITWIKSLNCWNVCTGEDDVNGHPTCTGQQRFLRFICYSYKR